MAETVTPYGGGALPLNSLQQAFAYDVNNQVTSITVVYQGVTYVQTFTWSAGNLVNISQWIPQ